MKDKLLTVLLLSLSVLAGCSNEPATAKDQLSAVNEMLSKGYEMTATQRADIEEQIALGKASLEAGDKKKAAELLADVQKKLEVIAETDRFNKSE